MPSDDGTIKLAHRALTDHPDKELLALGTGHAHPLWAGSISASTFLNNATGRMGRLMLKCHKMCVPIPHFSSAVHLGESAYVQTDW